MAAMRYRELSSSKDREKAFPAAAAKASGKRRSPRSR
jgi:hypothetical protein